MLMPVLNREWYMGVRRYGISLRVFNLVFFNNFGERVLSIFQRKLWPPALILMAAEGWGEKEIWTERVSDSRKTKRGVGVGE